MQKALSICKGLIDIATLPKGQSTLKDSEYVLYQIDNIINGDLCHSDNAQWGYPTPACH